MAVPRTSSNRNRPALDQAALERLALRYVERYATTRAKLAQYLQRKVRERGWEDEQPAAIAKIVERFSDLKYVDDKQFAHMRASSLMRRGYGERRISMALMASGVEEQDSAEVRATSKDAALETALSFAKRKRIGPFATAPLDPKARQKAFAALMRAGHSLDISRSVLGMDPEDSENLNQLD